jgi:uroporphyrinogen-III synthase
MTRVAVTTTAGRTAERVGGLVRAAGLEPVFLPCIEVVPSPEASLARFRAEADTADWVVVTSVRVVQIVWAAGMPARPSVAAVGTATARAVRRAGGRPEVVGERGAGDLLRLLQGLVRGRKVVFPHAGAADPEVARQLATETGALVAGPVYDTVPVAPAADPVEVVTFASPSAVQGWRLSRDLEGPTLAAMGPTTAAFLKSVGHPPRIVPSRTGFAALIAAVAEGLGTSERSRS